MYIIIIMVSATSFIGAPVISIGIIYRILCIISFIFKYYQSLLSFHNIFIIVLPQMIIEILITYVMSFMSTYLSIQSFKLTFIQKDNFSLKYLFNYILAIEEKNLRDQGVDLSMTEVHILEAIQKSESNMMSALAKRLMVTQGTLTVSTSKLVKKGYVERVKDEKDKRIVRLHLTDKASTVLEVHERFHEEMIDKALNELDVDKEQELIRSLKNIMKFFKEKY